MLLLKTVKSTGEIDTDGQQLWIKGDRKFTVGRKDCHFIIAGDNSISRSHASLTLSASSACKLIDNGSKYGTFVNKEQISQEKELNVGDIVTFGCYSSSYKLCSQKVTACSSGITKEKRDQVKKLITSLSFDFKSQITPECTHLVMDQINITAKVAVALGYGIPIVSINWLSDLTTSNTFLDEREYALLTKLPASAV